MLEKARRLCLVIPRSWSLPKTNKETNPICTSKELLFKVELGLSVSNSLAQSESLVLSCGGVFIIAEVRMGVFMAQDP